MNVAITRLLRLAYWSLRVHASVSYSCSCSLQSKLAGVKRITRVPAPKKVAAVPAIEEKPAEASKVRAEPKEVLTVEIKKENKAKASASVVAKHAMSDASETLPAAKKVKTTPKIQDWEDLDADDSGDPMMVSEYVEEIFAYYKQLEVSKSSLSPVWVLRPLYLFLFTHISVRCFLI